MLRISALVIAVLSAPAMSAKLDLSHCGHVDEEAAALSRWALAHEKIADAAQSNDSCGAIRNRLYEAAKTRQTISLCKDGDVRQRTLEERDAEINAFNNVIAMHCSH